MLPLELTVYFQSLTQQTNSTQNNPRTLGNLGNNIPTIFATLGLALLGILIPLTIAILQDLMRKKGEPNVNYCILDLHVILDKVFQTKLLIFYSALIFVPFLFWDIQLSIVHLAAIVSAIIGSVFILLIILKVYNWIKGNVSSYRKQYLEGLKNESDMVAVWGSIWQNNNMTPQDFKIFFEIYSKKIDGLIKEK